MSDWQPIKTAPKDALIDLWVKSKRSGATQRWVAAQWHDMEEDWYSAVHDNFLYGTGYFATHWMSIPAPPVIPGE